MRFEKISREQWKKDCDKIVTPLVKEISYDFVQIPKRGTEFSAGYDFFSPCTFVVPPHEKVNIPTGIRAVDMPKDFVLLMVVRSSIGMKWDCGLSNQVGVIDADYAFAENEGHIHVGLRNLSENYVEFKAGERIAQGIFTHYLVTDDDDANGKRTGGIGSTGK